MRTLARLLLWLGGWTAVGARPDADKAVIIAAPHTSNWDAVWALIYTVSVGLNVRFFAKHTLFWFPLSSVLQPLGCIPLDRANAGSAVKEVVRAFGESKSFYFGLAPEGTRRLRPHWKTGFYRIAREANVPVALGFLDFGRKRVGLGPTIALSGEVDRDLEVIRSFYADIKGRRPENTSPVIFAAED